MIKQRLINFCCLACSRSSSHRNNKNTFASDVGSKKSCLICFEVVWSHSFIATYLILAFLNKPVAHLINDHTIINCYANGWEIALSTYVSSILIYVGRAITNLYSVLLHNWSMLVNLLPRFTTVPRYFNVCFY